MVCHHLAKIIGHIKTTLLKGYMTKSIEGPNVKSPPFQIWWRDPRHSGSRNMLLV